MNPLLILQARAEARAALFATGEFDLADALEPLVEYARKRRLVEEFGSEAIFAIIHQPFKKVADL